ncbi:restriction endonuclease [Luteolibacter soli]|uniref:Restriction endonuclease n=1 Tax=Luteolibacter soli TaxID=3135280 RepID=A0ABU9B279_9BACT
MSSLRTLDIRLLDEVFDMGGGYVLDFSDRTMREFFADELNVDIDDPIYSRDGRSKAKRLRCFLKTVDDRSAAKALRVLWQHRQLMDESRGQALGGVLQGRFLQILDRLEGRSGGIAHSGPPPSQAFDVERYRTFKERLLALSRIEPQARGYAFEKFLRDLFNSFGLEAREPFRLKGEQIDGSFVMSNETYLVEAKWHNSFCGAEPLHAFHGKLDQKASWARGVFISYSGFTADGIYAFGRGKRVVCVSGLDLHEAFNREIPLTRLLEGKVRRAAETGDAFVEIATLFP